MVRSRKFTLVEELVFKSVVNGWVIGVEVIDECVKVVH